MNSQFTLDEDQEMETQPIYLSRDENKIASPCSSPIPQLSNNVFDTYGAITQLILAQHEHTSKCHRPATLPHNIHPPRQRRLSPMTLMMKRPAQLLAIPLSPYPILRIARHLYPLQLCQQITPIPDTAESPTPETRGQSDIFQPYNLPNPSTSNAFHNPPNISTVDSGWWITKCGFAPPSGLQWVGDGVFSMQKTIQPSQRRNCGRLSQPDSTASWDSMRTSNKTKCVHWWCSEWTIHFSPPESVAGCRLWRLDLLR